MKWFLIFALMVGAGGCSTFSGDEETGVVIAQRAQVRSSTAIVAADLKEVVRGDVLDILGSNTVEGEQWLRVRTRETDATEGWIEARNVMLQEMLDRSRQLAKEDEGTRAQASGQLRASTNIRLSPDRSANDNIMMKLESGARFDIVGWKHVPKPKASAVAESDDAPKAGSAPQTGGRNSAGGETKESDDLYELWYKVRLPQTISPAPAGWIYGKQVELTVPSDIIFYRTGREFVAWQRLDVDAREASQQTVSDRDEMRDGRPGSWVILEKSATKESLTSETSDFDRIFVLGYDKEKQEHYTAYRSRDVEGYLPLVVESDGGNKTFSVNVRHEGQMKEAVYRVIVDSRGMVRVEAQNEWARGPRKSGR